MIRLSLKDVALRRVLETTKPDGGLYPVVQNFHSVEWRGWVTEAGWGFLSPNPTPAKLEALGREILVQALVSAVCG